MMDEFLILQEEEKKRQENKFTEVISFAYDVIVSARQKTKKTKNYGEKPQPKEFS